MCVQRWSEEPEPNPPVVAVLGQSVHAMEWVVPRKSKSGSLSSPRCWYSTSDRVYPTCLSIGELSVSNDSAVRVDDHNAGTPSGTPSPSTVTAIDSVALKPPESRAVTVTVAVPDAAGVSVTVLPDALAISPGPSSYTPRHQSDCAAAEPTKRRS